MSGTSHRLTACLLVLAAGTAHAQSKGDVLFACCNLRHDGNWISDRQTTIRPFIPVGSRVTFVEFFRNRVIVDVDGKRIEAEADHGDFRGTREQFAEKLFTRDDPSLRLSTLEPEVRRAIQTGRIRLGMTRDQVVMALGHPRFDKARWTYFATPDGAFELDWDADMRLSAVHAPTRVRALVMVP